MLVYAVGRDDLPPLKMPARFWTEIVYFITPSGEQGVPALGSDEYWIRRPDAQLYLDELVVRIVSPLDAETKTEIELSEEHEAFLEWLVANEVEHVRVARSS